RSACSRYRRSSRSHPRTARSRCIRSSRCPCRDRPKACERQPRTRNASCAHRSNIAAYLVYGANVGDCRQTMYSLALVVLLAPKGATAMHQPPHITLEKKKFDLRKEMKKVDPPKPKVETAAVKA